jgi:putative membrane protein
MVQARTPALDPREARSGADRQFFVFNAIVSVAALAFIGWILLVRTSAPPGEVDLRFLPAVNASLNGLATILLAAGWIAIRRRAVRVHKRLMVAAFAASALFLVSYLTYHYVHGDTRYQGEGVLRLLYFVVLISHVLLSMAVVPMALTAFYLAYRRQFVRHARLTRIALPIWLYVSVTGVVIYFMLRGGMPVQP